MTKRVFLLVPEGLKYDDLTELQQKAIDMVFGQFDHDDPKLLNTKPYNGYMVVSAYTTDGFDPALMPEYGIDWEFIGLYRWDMVSPELEVIVPLDKVAFLNYLPDKNIMSEDGMEVIGTEPPTFHIPLNAAGWPLIK